MWSATRTGTVIGSSLTLVIVLTVWAGSAITLRTTSVVALHEDDHGWYLGDNTQTSEHHHLRERLGPDSWGDIQGVEMRHGQWRPVDPEAINHNEAVLLAPPRHLWAVLGAILGEDP